MTSLKEEIEFELCELTAERLTTKTILNRIMEKIEKRIDEMIKPYTDSETMLGKQTLKTLQEVKETLK